jgi:asparagine synthase (glutamine-hydrolysing)
MCAVVGLFHPHATRPPDIGLVRRMADALAHRGPDGAGFHAEPGLALGHRRLAIVDRAGGAQPMASHDGRVVLSFNGEIYNHAALRLMLERLGHGFRTRSDTEVILQAWRQWGLGALDRLEGMFAFALWDQGQGRLVLARDRLGEKPMHTAVLPDGGLAFASEIAGLRVLPELRRGFDPLAIDDFLALGYVPDPRSIHISIRRLPPAHFLLLARGERAHLAVARRYWRPPTRMAAAPADAPGELATRLAASVEARLMAEVPLGCFLSGGVDSGAVASLAARRIAGLATFTIGFAGSADERPAAAELAARIGATHHAAAASGDLLADARAQAAIFGEPFGDSSAVPTLAVCRLARRHVTVALSGDGGDEVFAGYRRHRWHMLAEGVRRFLPTGLRRTVLGRLARAYPKLDRAPRWLRARHTLTELSLDSALGYYATVCRLDTARRRALLSPAMRRELEGHDPAARFGELMGECDPEAPLLAAQYADLHTYLPGDILTKVDRTSMAVSLEVRPPLLDHHLVAWGLALPAALKLRNGVGKAVLRDAMRDILPAGFLQRPKQGFAAPLGPALRALGPAVRARLLGAPMRDSGIFDGRALELLLDEHLAGRFDHGQILWQLLVMEGFLAGLPAEAERAPAVMA